MLQQSSRLLLNATSKVTQVIIACVHGPWTRVTIFELWSLAHGVLLKNS